MNEENKTENEEKGPAPEAGAEVVVNKEKEEAVLAELDTFDELPDAPPKRRREEEARPDSPRWFQAAREEAEAERGAAGKGKAATQQAGGGVGGGMVQLCGTKQFWGQNLEFPIPKKTTYPDDVAERGRIGASDEVGLISCRAERRLVPGHTVA